MALSETARLIASLELDSRKFTKSLANANVALKKSESRAYHAGQQIGTGIKRGLAIAAAGVGVVAANVAVGVDSLIKLEQATAQTNAVIKSTGGVAKISAVEVGRLAEKYEGLNATVGDEVIRSGENLLLTFTNIRKKAFEPALKAALNMNTALGKGPEGLTNTVRLVGKALNDPTKGLTALNRVGVTFTKEQIKRIKGLQKEGKLYEAQKIIIGELDKRFGGSFLAGGNTTAGKVAKFTDSIEDLQRAMAEALLPAIGNIADALTELLADPAVMQGAKDLGKEIGKLFSAKNIKEGARIVGGVIDGIKKAAPVIKSGLGTAAEIIGKVIDEFQKLPPDVQKLALGALAVNKLTGGLITNLGAGIVGSILGQLKSAVVNVQGAVVNVNGAGGVPGTTPGAPAGGGGKIGTALKALGALTIVATAVAVTAESVQGFVQQNQELKDKGLNQAEIAALRYYSGDAATQQTIYKRLGYLPSKSDFDSAMGKLGEKVTTAGATPAKADPRTEANAENRAARQIRATEAFKTQERAANQVTQRQGERIADSGLKVYQATLDSKRAFTDAERETKRETTRGLNATTAAANKTASNVNTFHQELAAVNRRMSGEIAGAVKGGSNRVADRVAATTAAARSAGERARQGSLAAAEAIRKKNLVTNVNVVNKLNLSIRDTQRKLSFSQSMSIYG